MATRFDQLEEQLAEHRREAFERTVWPAVIDLRVDEDDGLIATDDVE